MAAATGAQAVTIDELVAKQAWAETIYCNAWNNKQIDACSGVTLQKVSNTQLLIVGFKEGTGNLKFTLVDDNGNTTTDGTMLSYAYDDNSGDGNNSLITGKEKRVQTVNGRRCMVYDMGRDNYYWSSTYDEPYVPYWRGRISQGADGNYEIAFPEGINGYSSSQIVAVAATLQSTNKNDGGKYIGRYYLRSYGANATATDQKSKYNDKGTSVMSTTSREYPMQVKLNDDGSFSLFNLANKGNAIDNNNGLTVITGTYDCGGGTFTIAPLQYAVAWHAWYTLSQSGTVYGAYANNHYARLRHFINTSSRDDDLDGTISFHGVAHNDAEEGWVTNDGRRRTTSAFDITVPDYTFDMTDNDPLYPSSWTTWADSYSNTEITGTEDVTVQVELNLHHHGSVADQGVYVGADINTVSDKADLVDHYEVMMVPGHLKSINEFTEHLCNENGHKKAQTISQSVSDTSHDYTPSKVSARSAATGGNDYSISKLVKANKIENVDPEGKYSFFIKTVYKDQSLTPTFHSLQYMSDYNTGVDAAEADLGAEIKADGGTIEVSGARHMTVTTIAGAEVYSGEATRVDVAPGIYIVKAGNTVKKVLVK